MAQSAILSLFATLSPEERVETFQMLVPLIAGVAPSGATGKKVVKSSAKAAAAPKAEKAPREASAWTQYVMAVKAETGLKMTEAMAEASRRRAAGDPSCPLPPVASAAKKPAASAPKKVAAPAPAPAPKSASAAAAEEEEEAGVDLEEVEVEGQDYFYAPALDNAAWIKEADGSRGAWAGYLNTETGEFDTTRPAPDAE